MSTFWTPDGERPISQDQDPVIPPQNDITDPDNYDDEASIAKMEALRAALSEAPVDVVIANHAFGLFELAALHLSAKPAHLEDAQLAIDALSAIVEKLAGRLGEAEPQLKEGLSSLQLAFVQIRTATEGGNAAN